MIFGRSFRAVLAGAAGMAALAASPAHAQTVAIIGGTVVIGDGSDPIPNGTVVIRDGRIASAGANMAVPAGAQTIDATGKWVAPGFFAGFSRLGLVEVSAVEQTNDSAADSSPFSAAIDVAPAINPRATPISVNRAAGVTRATVAPVTASSIFGGQGAVIDLGADMQPITRARAFQYVEFGEEGASEAGGSRAAAHALFRNALREASDLAGVARGQLIASGSGAAQQSPDQLPLEDIPDTRLGNPVSGRPEDVLLTRFDAAALVPVLQGRQLLMVHAERASDILQVIALRREFPRLRLVIVGAAEGWTIANEIAASGVPVIANPMQDLPSSFEQVASTQSNIGRMLDAGVEVAIGMIGGDDAHNVRYVAQFAGNLVALQRIPGATGVGWGEAMKMITSEPARIMGLGNQLGSLEAGRHADVVLWDGDPLELMSNVETVWIDGVEQPLSNRQTRLRDRYRNISDGQLPEGYDW